MESKQGQENNTEKELNNYYKSIFNSNPQAMLIYDEESLKILEVNNAAVLIYGYSEKEFLNLTIGDLRSDIEQEKLKKLLALAQKKELPASGKVPGLWVHRTKEGKEFFVEIFKNKINHQLYKNASLVIVYDVTEKVNYEKELENSEERFRKLTEATSEGILIHENGKVLEVNKAFCEIFGYSYNEVIGSSVLDFTAPESREYLMNKILQNVEETYVAIGIKKDGTKITCEINPREIEYNGRKVRVGGVYDITERRLNEERLKHSEQRFRMLAENASDIIFRYIFSNGKPVMDYVSPSVINITGYTQKDLLSQQDFIYSIVIEEDKAKYASIFKSEQNSLSLQIEYRVISKSGTILWLETTVNRVKDSNGNLLYLEGITRNITSRKELELQLKQSNKRFSLLADSYPIGVFITNEKGELTFINKQVAKIAEQASRKIGYIDWYKIIHEEDIFRVIESIKRGVEDQVNEFTIKFRIVSGKGNLKWIHLRASKLLLDAVLQGWVGTVEDVTDNILYEEKLKQSEERFKMLSEVAVEGIILSQEGIIKDINRSALSIFGYKSPKDLIGKNLIDITAEGSKNEINKLLSNKVTKPLKFIGKKSDGENIYLESQSSYIPFKGENYRVSVIHDIHQREMALRKLEENERTLSAILDNFNGLVYRCKNNRDWTMFFMSRGTLELTGYSADEFINGQINFNSIIVEEYRDLIWSKVQLALKSKSRFMVNYQIKTKSGLIKWVWEQGEGLFDNKGKLLGLEGFITDITAQKIAEQELEKSQRDYSNLVQNSPNGIIIYSNNKIKFVNSSALTIMGKSAIQEVVGSDITSFFNLERKNFSGSGILEYEYHNTENAIKYLEIQELSITYMDEDCVQWILHDVTSKRLAEKEKLRAQIAEASNAWLKKEIEERKRIEKQLEQEKRFSQNIIDSSLDIIMSNNIDGIITQYNEAAKRAFEYSDEEIKHVKTEDLFAQVKDFEKIGESFKEKGSFVGEVLNISKSGRTFVSYLAASLIKDENGKVVGSMGISRDITAQKRAELKLIESERNYRSLFTKAYIGFAQTNTAGKFIQINDRLSEILGYTSDELRNKYLNDVLPPEELDNLKEVRNKFIKGHIQNYSEEVICKNKDGQFITVNLTASLSLNDDGKAEYFILLFEDITVKKRNEEKIYVQSAKLNAIFESSSHLVWTVNRNLVLTSFNSNYAQCVLKFFNVIVDPFRSNIKTIVNLHPEDQEIWVDSYSQAFKGNSQQFEVKLYDLNGGLNWLEIFLHPIFNTRGEVFEVSAIGNDVTARKMVENKLEEQAAKLNSIIESSSHFIWTLNKDLVITSFNKNYADAVFKNTGISIVENQTVLTAFLANTTNDINLWQKNITNAFLGHYCNFESDLLTQSGAVLWTDVYMQPIIVKDSIIEEISIIAHDTTERKIVIQQNLLQAAKINAIFQTSSLMIYTISADYKLLSFNKNYFDYVKTFFNYETYAGYDLLKGSGNKEDFERLLRFHTMAIQGRNVSFESRVKDKKGVIHYFESFLDPVVLPDGRIEEVAYISHDITDKKNAEDLLKDSLKEKEVLLKEVHHRVKNNLQVISSILSLQSSYTKDKHVLDIIHESQNRIKSMSFIHETLYQTKNFSSINFSEYLENIVVGLSHTYQSYQNRVKLNLMLDKVILNLDTSIPCGLILNELVSNAFKYAFKGVENGELTVILSQHKNLVKLAVKDNGVGLPPDMDIYNTESLGLQLVIALIEQIDGKLEVNVKNGSEFIIIFTNKM